MYVGWGRVPSTVILPCPKRWQVYCLTDWWKLFTGVLDQQIRLLLGGHDKEPASSVSTASSSPACFTGGVSSNNAFNPFLHTMSPSDITLGPHTHTHTHTHFYLCVPVHRERSSPSSPAHNTPHPLAVSGQGVLHCTPLKVTSFSTHSVFVWHPG